MMEIESTLIRNSKAKIMKHFNKRRFDCYLTIINFIQIKWKLFLSLLSRLVSSYDWCYPTLFEGWDTKKLHGDLTRASAEKISGGMEANEKKTENSY